MLPPKISVLGIPVIPSSPKIWTLGARDKEENACSNTQWNEFHSNPWFTRRHKWRKRLFASSACVPRRRRIRQMSNLPKNSSVNSRNLVAILLFGNGHVRALMVSFLIWVMIPGSEPIPSIISRRRASRSPMEGN